MKKYQLLKLLYNIFLFAGFTIISNAQNFDLTEFDTSGRATIRTIVPNATSVRLRGLSGTWGLGNTNLPFTNAGGDMWQVTTSPIATGFHYYRLEINGVLSVNPNERVYYGGNSWTSGLEIPGEESDFYSVKEVPHGSIRMQLYYSVTTQNVRRCFIYLPPGYDTRSDESYPVLFLQHGNSENEFSWPMQGKVNFILDNLIAEGSALPMIVVMDSGMTFVNNTVGYGELVMNDLIPLLENNYKVINDKRHRAVAGLSMGGSQAVVAGLFNTDVFSYVGDFSGGFTGFDWMPYTQNINDSIELLWLGWGTSDEYVGTWVQFSNNLQTAGIHHVRVTMDGGHQWQVWRKCLYQYAQLLFKPFTYPPESSLQPQLKETTGLWTYPNPFRDYLHIQLDKKEDLIMQFQLFDVSGIRLLSFNGTKKMAEEKLSENLCSAPANNYFLSVTDKQSVYKVKIIKQ